MAFRKKTGYAIASFIMLVLLFPLSAKTAELTTGTIIVCVVDESGETISGNWYLHRGSTDSGMLVRNGSFGEKFEADAGSYYLEVHGQASKHPYFTIFSKNPQILEGGSKITFSVQYFETKDQMEAATGNPPTAQELETAAAQEASDIFDEHGCNSTQGFVWCAKDESCTKYWTPNCKEVSVGSTEPVQEEPITDDAESVEPAVEESSGTNVEQSQVPTFETAPVSTPVSAASEPNTVTVAPEGLRLVQTGSSAAILFILSVLLSLGIVRRSVFKRNG